MSRSTDAGRVTHAMKCDGVWGGGSISLADVEGEGVLREEIMPERIAAPNVPLGHER